MKRLLIALAVAGLVVTSPAAADEIVLPKPKQNWIELRTANFRFFSNAGRVSTRQIAIDLEQLRAVLAELTDYDLHSPIPTSIYVFKSDRSFRPFKTIYRGRPADVSGYFIGTDHANHIALTAASRDASAIVFHEYVHYISKNNLWYLPLWFSEGLAEFYESFLVDGDTVYIGLPLIRHLASLNGRMPIPLDQLFAVTRRSELYNEANRKGAFYAQSWAVVHYLLLGDEKRRRQLDVYLGMVRRGVDVDDAFSESFGIGYAKLEVELRAYLRSLSMPWIETTTNVDLDREFQIREMSYAEVLYRLGTLLASHEPERPESTAYFNASIENDGDYGPPISALAIEAERRADWSTAQALHDEASLKSPHDPMVLYRKGVFMSRRGANYPETVDVLTRSAKIDPSFAPAWAALAAVYAEAGDTSDRAVEAARRAHAMRPYDAAAARDLVRLYLRLDRRTEAAELIENALASNRRLQRGAWTLVIEQDLFRVRELLGQSQIEAALARLTLAEGLAARSLHPEAAERAISSTHRLINDHLAARLFTEAQALFSEDDREGARALLNRALELTNEGAVAASCRQLLTLIDHPELLADKEIESFNPSPTPEEIEEFNSLVAQKDFEGALEYLESLRARLGEAQQRWLDDRIDEVQRTIDYNRFVDAYNQAVEHYNQRQYRQAITVLEELLTTLPDGPEAQSARALLDDAMEAMD